MDADLGTLEILKSAGEVHVRPCRFRRAPGHMLVRVCTAVYAAPAHRGTWIMLLPFLIRSSGANGGNEAS
jgi:hypothetical protein